MKKSRLKKIILPRRKIKITIIKRLLCLKQRSLENLRRLMKMRRKSWCKNKIGSKTIWRINSSKINKLKKAIKIHKKTINKNLNK